MRKQAIRFSSLGGYRRFCLPWWSDLVHHFTGLAWHQGFGMPLAARWGRPGWVYDLQTFWHRGRYGWAPRDTWSLYSYIEKVLAGSLYHLAVGAHGAPVGYPGTDGTEDTNFDQWEQDLKRWAQAFSESPDDVDIYDKPKYLRQNAEEQRRREAIHQALKEMEPWWDALWD